MAEVQYVSKVRVKPAEGKIPTRTSGVSRGPWGFAAGDRYSEEMMRAVDR